ncbi:hypothetical protein TYRP_020735 [Tyrophagus putrescentiae]|nr:hypothetical protein TYRP_020735 [Tyrophagus putrescentiae]
MLGLSTVQSAMATWARICSSLVQKRSSMSWMSFSSKLRSNSLTVARRSARLPPRQLGLRKRKAKSRHSSTVRLSNRPWWHVAVDEELRFVVDLLVVPPCQRFQQRRLARLPRPENGVQRAVVELAAHLAQQRLAATHPLPVHRFQVDEGDAQVGDELLVGDHLQVLTTSGNSENGHKHFSGRQAAGDVVLLTQSLKPLLAEAAAAAAVSLLKFIGVSAEPGREGSDDAG